jgi:hypothetical protein
MIMIKVESSNTINNVNVKIQDKEDILLTYHLALHLWGGM